MKNIFHFEAMTTHCEVVIYSPNRETATEIAKEILVNTKKLEKKYNYYDPQSIISHINSRQLQDLDLQTKELLQQAKTFYNLTNSLFDITIATLKPAFKLETLDAVHAYREQFHPFVGCDHFQIKKGKIYFDNPHTTLDLGGLVKEYAVDKAVEILKKHKINHALINFGGDLYALGCKPNGDKFKIGIKNPSNPSENLLYVDLQNEALTTSAHYERFSSVENQQFSHIISTSQHDLALVSATVITQSTLISGVFSTSLMIDSSLNHSYKTIKITSDMQIETENF